MKGRLCIQAGTRLPDGASPDSARRNLLLTGCGSSGVSGRGVGPHQRDGGRVQPARPAAARRRHRLGVADCYNARAASITGAELASRSKPPDSPHRAQPHAAPYTGIVTPSAWRGAPIRSHESPAMRRCVSRTACQAKKGVKLRAHASSSRGKNRHTFDFTGRT